MKAAALAAGTLLTTPYLFMYDMMVLAIPVAFLVRIGLKGGFRAYELPALGTVAALLGCYMLTGMPTGFGATLVVAALVLRRAGSWWRPEPVPHTPSRRGIKASRRARHLAARYSRQRWRSVRSRQACDLDFTRSRCRPGS